ncbi:hypothetical protein S40288_05915 [Stachybotrys chartarum IBT 40288]|nr:hypothetical protein S40288_05915 [Stachybotrys chartarum IBT 40288]
MASSSDEGEILEHGKNDLKATSLPYAERSGVDRQDRNRTRDSSPDYDARPRYGTSARRSSPRGFGRYRDSRDYQHHDRRDRNARRNGPPNETSHRDDYRRSRVAYEDLDRPASRASELSYDGRHRERDRDHPRYRDRSRDRHYERENRDGRRDQRAKTRSRSPNSSERNGNVGRKRAVEGQNGQSGHDLANKRYGNFTLEKGSDIFCKYVADGVGCSSNPNPDGESTAPRKRAKLAEPEPDMDWEPPEQIDEEAEIERRRKRREEILATAKSSSATPLLLHAVGAVDKARSSTPGSSHSQSPSQAQTALDGPATPSSHIASPMSPASNGEPSPGGINLLDDQNLMNMHGKSKTDDEDGPSAADYDPTADMKEDERRDELRHGQVVLHGEPHAVEAPIQQSTEKSNEDGLPETAKADDDDDDLDMFADEFDEEKFTSKPIKTAVPIEGGDAALETQANGKGGILEGDDKDGYYKIRIGELLFNRYQIQATLGRGMFSGVARAVDINTQRHVAIKIMRNNDALRKGGFTEIAILQKLNSADPENRKHIVKFEHHFDYKGHLCMVFENLSMNLREVLRKFGNNVGINMQATKTYAYQIFVALAHMRKCSIIHADLKPDNILVSENRASLKICDLGTAIDRSDAATAHTEITPYLVSRFYRAPEIILGMPYDYGVDTWSIGCTLYELYTGKILFTGDSNNQMLKAIMETRGKITNKIYKRGQLSAVHFDENGQFVSVERDKILGKTNIRTLPLTKPTRDIRTRLLATSSGMSDAESKDLQHFIDLLEQCLAINPDKRIKPADALKHPFFAARAPSHWRK